MTVRISRNPGQRKAWRESNLVAIFLAKGWTNLLLWEQAWKIHEVVAGNSDLGVAYAPARKLLEDGAVADQVSRTIGPQNGHSFEDIQAVEAAGTTWLLSPRRFSPR